MIAGEPVLRIQDSEMSHFYFTSYLNHDLEIANDFICKLILTCMGNSISFKSAKDIDDCFYIYMHILFQGDWRGTCLHFLS